MLCSLSSLLVQRQPAPFRTYAKHCIVYRYQVKGKTSQMATNNSLVWAPSPGGPAYMDKRLSLRHCAKPIVA